MKKQLLFFLLFATSFNTAIAQSVFNEDDLIGEWVVNDEQEMYNYLVKLRKIIFRDYSSRSSYGYTTPSGGTIRDYYISTSNHLHINFESNCYIFKIITLTSDTMVLLLKYEYGDIKTYEYKFHKEGASAVEKVTDEMTDSDNIYDLKGQLLENEPDSGVYIQNGKKYVKK